VGPGNYNTHVAKYHVSGAKAWGRAVHSLYLTVIPEMGIIGIICFLGILAGNVQSHRFIRKVYSRYQSNWENGTVELTDGFNENLLRSKRLYVIALGLSGAMIAYLITGMFISVLWYAYFWNFSALFAATHNSADRLNQFLDKPR
jgi:O-antigen ligase